MPKQKEKKKISMKKILKILTGAGVVITGANEFHNIYIKNKKLEKQNEALRKKVNQNDDGFVENILEENKKLEKQNKKLQQEISEGKLFFNTTTTHIKQENSNLKKEIMQLKKKNTQLKTETQNKIIFLQQENFNLKKQDTQKILQSNINKLNSENKKLKNKINTMIDVLEKWKNETYSSSYRDEYQDVINKLNNFGRILRRL